jgi:uncharacterized protein (TIGR03118 family)
MGNAGDRRPPPSPPAADRLKPGGRTMPRRALALAASIGLLLGIAFPAAARNVNGENTYAVDLLWSDVPGLAAGTDPDLVNGWGISHSSTSPWWVSNEGTDTSTLYNGDTGAKLSLVVTVPGGPTGQVFNGSGDDFKVDAGTGPRPSRFIFATEQGAIYGWNTVGTAAIEAADTPDAIYLGLAIGSVGTSNFLYAANFHAGTVDVFDRTFDLVSLGGAFTDPTLPDGYAPFGIQNLGGLIYVAYAKQDEDAEEEVAGEGFGYVSAFDTDGNFVRRVASAGDLNAPWGLALAPSDFGKFSGDLLVGNFGDGRIHAYRSGEDGWEEHGVVKGEDHRPIEIDGLWGIGFGNDAGAGPSTTLFFAAGPEDETHGLFGSITAP